jgi:hypothetical protein
MSRTLFIIALIPIFAISCAPKISPVHYDIPSGAIEFLASTEPIRIMAQKVDKSEYKIPGGYKDQEGSCVAIMDINEVNEKVISLLKTELAKNAIKVTDSAQKALFIEFQSGSWFFDQGVWTTEMDLFLSFKVETANGYQQEYEVKGATYIDYERALGDALTNISKAILNDREIRKYIEGLPEQDGIATRLKELKDLADQGLITPEEYKQRKDEILDTMLDQQ